MSREPGSPTNTAFRPETMIATLIGALAVAVSAYTAYIQRQQVRAQVWPVLEYYTGNQPKLRLWVANKGVGPALIKHVVITVDGAPVRDWNEAMDRLLGPGQYRYSYDSIGRRTLSAGEALDIFVPHFEGELKNPLWLRFDRERMRVGVELCYCSALGDCWTASRTPGQTQQVDETKKCPAPSARTFNQ